MNDEEQRRRIATLIVDLIQEFIQESDELSEVLEEASKEGYDVLLTIMSGVMIRRRDEAEDTPLPDKFELTQRDKEFLESIGVAVSEEE